MIKLSRWMTYGPLKTYGASFGKICVNMNFIHYMMSNKKIIDIWKNFSEEQCVKMIDSIPKGLRAIVRKQGQRITKRDY